MSDTRPICTYSRSIYVLFYAHLSTLTVSKPQSSLHNVPSKPLPQIPHQRIRAFDGRKMSSCLVFPIELNICNSLHPVHRRNRNLSWKIANAEWCCQVCSKSILRIRGPGLLIRSFVVPQPRRGTLHPCIITNVKISSSGIV